MSTNHKNFLKEKRPRLSGLFVNLETNYASTAGAASSSLRKNIRIPETGLQPKRIVRIPQRIRLFWVSSLLSFTRPIMLKTRGRIPTMVQNKRAQPIMLRIKNTFAQVFIKKPSKKLIVFPHIIYYHNKRSMSTNNVEKIFLHLFKPLNL